MTEELKLLDVQEVADMLRVSTHTVRRWSAPGEGGLQKIKLGSRTLFDPADVAKFVEGARNRKGPKEPVET